MNKIKGSSSAVKMKYLLFVFAAAVLVVLPTRVYQLLALVDTTNGFFKENDVTIPVLYAVVVVFALIFLVLSFISKEVPSPKLPTGKNPVLGIASFVMTAGLGLDMFRILRDTIPANHGQASVFFSILKINLSESGGAFTILEFIFAFFAIVYFLVFGLSHLNGKASYKDFKLLALAPLCWSMTALVTRLMNAISFIKVSELLFEIAMLVFVMLFFLTFARISSGVFTEDSMWGIYGYGLTAALLAAIVTIPRIVIMLVGLEAVEGYEFDFSHLTTMLFIVAYVFASLGVGFKDGLRNRRAVNEIELPDDFEAVTKKDDSAEAFSEIEVAEEVEIEAEEEIIEKEMVVEPEKEDNINGFAVFVDELNSDESDASEDTADEVVENEIEEVAEIAEKTVEAVIEEAVEVSAEEVTEAVEESVEEVEPVAEGIIEQTAETVEEITEETSEEIVEEVADKAVEETAEKTEKENSDELKIVSLADLKKKNQNK